MPHSCADVVISDFSLPGWPPINTPMTKRISLSEDSHLEPLKRAAVRFIHWAPSMRAFCTARDGLRRLVILWVLFGVTVMAVAQDSVQPLKPLDRSSPRAALKTFLDTVDNLSALIESEYLETPSRAEFLQLIDMGDVAMNGLDLSEIPAAMRTRSGRTAMLSLYDTLNKIRLPPWEAIPDVADLTANGTNTIRWVIPDTEIVLERSPGLNGEGVFLFSPETVERASEFYKKVEGLPYQRTVPLENLNWILETSGGWMIPYSWVQALPDWLEEPLGGQATWKWIGLLLILGVAAFPVRWVFRLSRWRKKERPFLEALAQLTLPVGVLILTPAVIYLMLVQLKLMGSLAVGIEVVGTTLVFLTGAWLVWRAAPVFAEAVISSPRSAISSSLE